MTLTGSGENTDNSIVQRKQFQLLNILEPLMLNDENVIVGINAGLIEIMGEMLIFQSQNLINIDRNIPT